MNSTSLSFLSPLLSLSQASLLVHPDKCAHPRAQDAFEVLNAAVAVLRGTGGGTPEEGAARLKELRYVLDYCKDQVLAARAASLKSDAVARLAATVVEGGADAVQAAWEAFRRVPGGVAGESARRAGAHGLQAAKAGGPPEGGRPPGGGGGGGGQRGG